MFGTSGVRGIVNEEVSCALAMKIGNAAGAMGKKIIVGRDCRTSGQMLAFSFMAGAMHAGADVIDIGIVPTPALSFACMKEKCIGAMVTASHNPPEYNGIKLFFEGREFPREWEKGIEGKVKAGIAGVEWNKAGQAGKMEVLSTYSKFLLSKVAVDGIRERKPKVVVDCGNAAASGFMPKLLRDAGCEVVELFCEPSGMPGRGLEPNEENLKELCKIVKEKKADIGIAHDGDADRAIIVDENGKLLGLDAQLGVIVKYMLEKKKGKIISTVESSLSLREIVQQNGSTLEITPVGSLHVAQLVGEKNAVFGGEPCGEYVFSDGLPCPDGPLAALYFLQILCEKGKLSALAAQVKSYPIARKKFACENKEKARALEKIKAGLHKISGKKSGMDGLRIDFEDGWLLVRPSGTEPIMRLTCECKTQKRLEEVCKAAQDAIEKAVA
ncbi:Phosphoglucomutase/phosphomannomutase [Candidatus Anstonella stagnisolia]|nr:Phosphoglucomutase/phosphomannomutase [Candidatus Anstonella stagnisolia]